MGNRNGVEITNAKLKNGNTVKIKVKIADDAKSFWIGLGTDEHTQALNISYDFSRDGVIVLKSCSDDIWGQDQVEFNPLKRGTEVKFEVTLGQEVFDVKLPDRKAKFKRRDDMEIINWIKVAGDIECTCVC